MKSVWASSAAFKSLESHKAETPDWPLGILCSSGSDKKTDTYNRGRGWTEKMGLWRQCGGVKVKVKAPPL